MGFPNSSIASTIWASCALDYLFFSSTLCPRAGSGYVRKKYTKGQAGNRMVLPFLPLILAQAGGHLRQSVGGTVVAGKAARGNLDMIEWRCGPTNPAKWRKSVFCHRSKLMHQLKNGDLRKTDRGRNKRAGSELKLKIREYSLLKHYKLNEDDRATYIKELDTTQSLFCGLEKHSTSGHCKTWVLAALRRSESTAEANFLNASSQGGAPGPKWFCDVGVADRCVGAQLPTNFAGCHPTLCNQEGVPRCRGVIRQGSTCHALKCVALPSLPVAGICYARNFRYLLPIKLPKGADR